MKKLYLMLLLVLFSQQTLAGWHQDNLVGMNIFANGGLSITVETTHECGSTVLAVATPESEHVNRIISVLLAHQAQGKALNFAIQSCSGTTAIIDRVRTY